MYSNITVTTKASHFNANCLRVIYPKIIKYVRIQQNVTRLHCIAIVDMHFCTWWNRFAWRSSPTFNAIWNACWYNSTSSAVFYVGTAEYSIHSAASNTVPGIVPCIRTELELIHRGSRLSLLWSQWFIVAVPARGAQERFISICQIYAFGLHLNPFAIQLEQLCFTGQ